MYADRKSVPDILQINQLYTWIMMEQGIVPTTQKL